MKNKPIDPIAIKVAIKNGQLVVFEKNGNVFIKDAPDGDCVCILQRERRENEHTD